MRKPSLTTPSERIDGRLCHRYAWRGREVPVCDSMANMLLVIELFGDEELAPREKARLLVPMLFPESLADGIVRDAGDGLWDLVQQVLWDACGLDVTGERDCSGDKVFDWEEDAARIQASVMSAYHMEWGEFSRGRSFADGCALLGELLESGGDTPFARAVAYRVGKPPKRTKYNGEQVRAWNEARDHFALGSDGGSDAMERENAAASSLFASLRKAGER